MPDPHSLDPGQVSGELPQTRLEQQAPHVLVGLPEIIALRENLIVVFLLVFRPRGRGVLFGRGRERKPLPSALGHRVIDSGPPFPEFGVVQETLDDQESLFRVAFLLLFSDLSQHCFAAFLSGK